jgi:shikimate dehydrogenase
MGLEKSIKTYCIIGDPIEHSLSPAMHNAAFNFLKLRSTYIAYRVAYSELAASICSLKEVRLAGFNVTIPHKTRILKYIDVLDRVASKAGAVNTVQNVDGVLYGYNTDVGGFLRPLVKRGINLNGLNVLLLGAGGAARAVVVALSSKTENLKISIANRNRDRAKELAKIGNTLGANCEAFSLQDVELFSYRANLIVNTLPLGMHNEKSIINVQYIPSDSIVYDVVYRPVLTDLLKNAKQAGATLVFGYEMLLEQGAESFQIWTGIPAPLEVMRKSLLGPFGE